MPPGGVLSWLVLLAVGYVPGAALVVAVARGRARRWDIVAGVAPVVSIGLLFSVAQLLEAVGFDVSARLLVPPVYLIAAGACAHAWRSRRLPRIDRAAVRSAAADVVLVGAIIVLAMGVWNAGRNGAAIMPNYDSVNHGTFVRRIASLNTIDIDEVVVQDSATEAPATSYYPLGVHLLAATVVDIAHTDVPDALFLMDSVVAVTMWTLGCYALARLLLPWRWGGVAAAALSLCMLQYPYKPISWGGMAAIVGTAALPPVLALGLLALRDEPRGNVPLFAFGCGALFTMHNSQLPGMAVMLVTIGASAVFRWRNWRRIPLRTWIVSVPAFLAPFWLGISSLANGISERQDVDKPLYKNLAPFVGQVVTLSVNLDQVYLLPVVLLVGGIAAAFARRVGYGIVAAWAAWAFLVLVAGFDAWWTTPFKRFTTPWYGQYERISYYLVLPVVLLGAALVCTAAESASRAIERLRALHAPRLARGVSTRHVTAVIGTALVVLALLGGTIGGINYLEREFGYWAVISPAALDFGDTVPGIHDGSVIASTPSGGMWLSNADPAIRVFGGLNEGITPAGEQSWDDHEVLIGRLPEAGRDPAVDALVRKYDVRWVFVNTFGIGGAPPVPTPEALAKNPCFRLVASSGPNQLWSVCRAA